MLNAEWPADLTALLSEALTLVDRPGSFAPVARFQAAARRVCSGPWRVLFAGLRSVGKSSFVGTLWGDAQMLPTAVRDCTQTITLIRPPAPGEEDRRLNLLYLPRAKVLEYALQGVEYYHLSRLLHDSGEQSVAALEDLPPEARLRTLTQTVRRVFTQRPDILVLHEELTDELEELEQLCAFLDSPAYQPEERLPARWEDRVAHLMGRRRPDGRSVEAGRLRALALVEVVRATTRWPADAPHLLDSPWVPPYHEARRAKLILEEAQAVDVLVLLALPERFEPEEWVLKLLEKRPELARCVVVVFNQIDTLDPATLYAPDGFAETYAGNRRRLERLGIRAENVWLSCARLPFLRACPQEQSIIARTERLQAVLAHLAHQARKTRREPFTGKLLAACDPADAGLNTFAAHLTHLRNTMVRPMQAQAALRALQEISVLEIPPANRAAWQALQTRAQTAKNSNGNGNGKNR